MQKAVAIVICGLLLLAINGYAQEGFVGPYQSQLSQELNISRSGQITPMTVTEVMSFTHDSPVLMMGNIINTTKKDNFTFKDSTGDITIKIKQGEWKGMMITPNDRVVIAGHLKINRLGQQEIDVRMIIKG